MKRVLWAFVGVVAVSAALAGEDAQSSLPPAESRSAATETTPAELTPYQQLLVARAPLLSEVRMLRARRRVFEVAADPEKGEQLERDIKAAFAEVVALYERYLNEHPDDAGAHYDLGALYYDEGEDENRAAALWLRTIELDPRFDLAHNSLAVHYADSAEHEKALLHISTALRLNPDVAMYHFNAATFHFNFRTTATKVFGWDLRRTWQEATSEYKEAMRLAPSNYVFARDYAQSYYSGCHFQLEPDYVEARRAWEHSLPLARSASERVMVLTNLARVSCFADDPDAARDYLKRALRLSPHNPVALHLQRKMEEGQPITPPSAFGAVPKPATASSRPGQP